MASAAGLTAAGATEGAVTGAVSSGVQAGLAGGNIAADALKGAATGAGTGAAGGVVGGAMSAAAGKGASLLSKLGHATKGASTGSAANVATEGATQTATVVNGQSTNQSLLNIGNTHSLGGNLAQQANKASTKAPVPATNVGTPPQLRPAAKITTGGAGSSNVGKVAGQYGVQGALSLLSAGMAAKQSKAANAVSQQSLQFQRQTYQEQKAEKESFKAGMKQTAQTAHESSLLFGSALQGSDANSTLLTSYNTSGNGAAGDYSILTYSKSRDKT